MSLELACEMIQVSPGSPGSFLGLLLLAAPPTLTTVTCHFQKPRDLVAVIWSPPTGLSQSLGTLMFHGLRVAWLCPAALQAQDPKFDFALSFYVAGLMGGSLWICQLLAVPGDVPKATAQN